jgi:hypothetical protein
MATTFLRALATKLCDYLKKLIIEPNAYYLRFVISGALPFWIARRSNLGAQRIGMPEKTAISLDDGANKVHGMLDPEWVEQLFASRGPVFLEPPT